MSLPFFELTSRSMALVVIAESWGCSLGRSGFCLQTVGGSLPPLGTAAGTLSHCTGRFPVPKMPSTGLSRLFTLFRSPAVVGNWYPAALATSSEVLPLCSPAVMVSAKYLPPPPKLISARVFTSCSEMDPLPPLSTAFPAHFARVSLGPLQSRSVT
ncbi:Uncharacterised protein [Mycobacteroides abscessus subsp. abscessus]|nr:Uncharacterised protein [Mycobacteroides abscessus subsp. abscessus]